MARSAFTMLIAGALLIAYGFVAGIRAAAEIQTAHSQLREQFADDELIELPSVGSMTAADLHDRLDFELNLFLVVNLGLGALMLGMFAWARRAPLRANAIALASFTLAVAFFWIRDPSTLLAGVLWKIGIALSLTAGCSGALAEHRAQARAAMRPGSSRLRSRRNAAARAG